MEKFTIRVVHLKKIDYENDPVRYSMNDVIYQRYIGLYDNREDAIDKYIDIMRDQQGITEGDLREIRNDLMDGDFAVGGNYSYIGTVIHDIPGRYEGPGAYTIDKRRLQ